MNQRTTEPTRISCGCCNGPEADCCTCWNHQDTPNGRPPRTCSAHAARRPPGSADARAAPPAAGAATWSPKAERCQPWGTEDEYEVPEQDRLPNDMVGQGSPGRG